MQKRYIFSGVENFWLFDFYDKWGNVNEDVFAFTNEAFGEKALVLFNNIYEKTKGILFTSSPKLDNNKNLITKNIFEVLNIKNDVRYFYIYQDHKTNLSHIKRVRIFIARVLKWNCLNLNAECISIFMKFMMKVDI